VPNELKMLQETHDKVIKLYVVLLGVNGHGGLIEDIQNMCKDIQENRRSIWRNRLMIYTLIALLMGNGVLLVNDLVHGLGP